MPAAVPASSALGKRVKNSAVSLFAKMQIYGAGGNGGGDGGAPPRTVRGCARTLHAPQARFTAQPLHFSRRGTLHFLCAAPHPAQGAFCKKRLENPQKLFGGNRSPPRYTVRLLSNRMQKTAPRRFSTFSFGACPEHFTRRRRTSRRSRFTFPSGKHFTSIKKATVSRRFFCFAYSFQISPQVTSSSAAS